MNLHSISGLALSAERGWPELVSIRPRLLRIFASVVLPLALVPPLMLWFAGTHHPETFPPELASRSWGFVAVAFFVAEIATLAAMGWLLRQAASSYDLEIDWHDSFLLASIAPVPMWLSALGLLIPSLAAAAVVAVAGLALSCAVMFHGIEAYCRTREQVLAAGLVQTVIGAGLVAWASLVAFAFT